MDDKEKEELKWFSGLYFYLIGKSKVQKEQGNPALREELDGATNYLEQLYGFVPDGVKKEDE